MLPAHNKMLEAQIVELATSSSTTLSKLPSKPKPNAHEQCKCVILKGGSEDSKGVELEEGGVANRAVGERKVISLRL